ncbi:MAG: DNA-processing protein DprA [Ilumatobacteraceae bacterium]
MTASDPVIAAALTTLPGLGPARIRLLLAHHEPADAWAALRGRAPMHPMVRRSIPADTLTDLRPAADRLRPSSIAERCAEHGIDVVLDGDPDYPVALAADPERPVVLFLRGDRSVLEARRVAVVGTRNATRSGLATAEDLGRQLCEAGVAVISGLARGIDGAAHHGVRTVGGPGAAVGVVGCGLDRPYPRQHAALWAWVGDHGLLVSEWAPATEPTGWRFPLRNRIIAGLAEVLVVVESRERGGSLITAGMAIDRGVEVMVVPGSPRCRASSGTNQLLTAGAAPVTSVDDVLMMLGLDHRRDTGEPHDPRPLPDALGRRILEVCMLEPTNLDGLMVATGQPLHVVALAAARLERSGWLVEADGWFEPLRSRLRAT